MDAQTYLEHLKQDGAAMAVAAERDLDAPVPSCPEWDVAALVAHTGLVHRHKMATVQHGGTEEPQDLEIEPIPSEDTELVPWFRRGVDGLIATLAAADPEDPAWSWAGDHRVAFWIRRMAQETTVHRWDAENAVGDAGPIDAELAADGVDEMLRVFIPREEIVYEGTSGSIHLRCTDQPDEWFVSLEADKVPVAERGSGDHDAVLEGTAEDLLLLVWRRIELDLVGTDLVGALVTDIWHYLEGPGQ